MDVGCSSRWLIIPIYVLFAVGTTASDRGEFVILFTLFWYAHIRLVSTGILVQCAVLFCFSVFFFVLLRV